MSQQMPKMPQTMWQNSTIALFYLVLLECRSPVWQNSASSIKSPVQCGQLINKWACHL